MKNFTRLLLQSVLVGAGLLALSNTAALAAADDAYTANDVLLFLQNPAGAVGNDKVAYFSLGNTVSVFRDSAAGSVTNLGNINTTLNATFGSDWADKASTIFVGAAGQQGSTSATHGLCHQSSLRSGHYWTSEFRIAAF